MPVSEITGQRGTVIMQESICLVSPTDQATSHHLDMAGTAAAVLFWAIAQACNPNQA